MKKWRVPDVSPESFPKGDMPGDTINIGESHIRRVEQIIPYLKKWMDSHPKKKSVISIFGGSGVGKSEIGSLLAYYLHERGLTPYLLSGDNYPHRIPQDNDKERLRIYRNGVLSALASSIGFSSMEMDKLQEVWQKDDDLTVLGEKWNKFSEAGRMVLNAYLGTEHELDFALLNWIIKQFKDEVTNIPLKRMGREINDLRMEPVDFSSTKVLIIEWTHGNSPLLIGVDYSVFLYSTPEETLAYRLARARDKGADSPFVSLVLALEQEKLAAQVDSASLIVSMNGTVLSKEALL